MLEAVARGERGLAHELGIDSEAGKRARELEIGGVKEQESTKVKRQTGDSSHQPCNPNKSASTRSFKNLRMRKTRMILPDRKAGW